MDTTFSDDEKRFVLGEMIKVSTVDISTLVDFIKAHQVEPNWMSMQLPGGRNMNQCLGTVANMFQTKLPPPNLTNFKRKSLGDLSDHPAKRQAMTAPLEPSLASGRAIQPRLPINGYPAAVPVTISPPVTSTGKKRGRPSKADKEAQARAVYSRMTEYPPITPAPSAPTVLNVVQVQREYATSPGYEYSSNLIDQKPKKRIGAIDGPQQTNSSFPLNSPVASTTNTPRALPEPLEQVERATLSPRDRGQILDSRSPPLLPHILPPQDSSQGHPHLQPRTQPLPPFSPSPRTSQAYEPHRGIDPIFPNRDRSRNISDQIKDTPPPVTTVANRS